MIKVGGKNSGELYISYEISKPWEIKRDSMRKYLHEKPWIFYKTRGKGTGEI